MNRREDWRHVCWPAGLRQSILSYNGAAIIAMAGKDCVGIAWYGIRAFW